MAKLKYEHVYLTSFSKMRVDLAAEVCIGMHYGLQQGLSLPCIQVLSNSVSKALALTGQEEVRETVKFTEMFDKFFDMLNVRGLYEGENKRKDFRHHTPVLKMTD